MHEVEMRQLAVRRLVEATRNSRQQTRFVAGDSCYLVLSVWGSIKLLFSCYVFRGLEGKQRACFMLVKRGDFVLALEK